MPIEEIIHQFFDNQPVISAAPFGTGHINDTWRIALAGASGPTAFILQRINHEVFRQPEAVMRNIALVAEHLSRQDYPLDILRPLPTLSGDLWYKNEDGYWRAFPFIENTMTIDRVETEAQAFEAASAFGEFLRALHGINARQLAVTIPGFHDGLRRFHFFQTVLANALPDRLDRVRKEVGEILQNQWLFQKVAALDLPLRAVHHDTKINNVLFDAYTQKARCVIDLDTVMPGVVLSDFGDMVRTFTSPADEDEADLSKVEMRAPIFKALSEGFLEKMSDVLTPAEKENLAEGGRWLTLMQAVRFLGDYLAGDVYYKTHYPEHNLVRTRNQLHLFRSL
jgi:aminoglycoside phosphotransferase (APT) family kinase protein